MTEFLAGGRRRLDRVLAAEFVAGLSELDLDGVRARRSEADQEEADLSYARRLLQGRLDILRAEQTRRAGGAAINLHPRSDQEIVDTLAHILADDPRTDRGSGRFLAAEPSRVGEHRREAERAVADLGESDPTTLSTQELTEVIRRLAEIEARVSHVRHEVQLVVDTLTEEIARRYTRGEVSFV
jgi:hypothetical protein